MRRLLQSLIAVMLFSILFTIVSAEEYPPVDISKNGTITVSYEGEGASFKLYHLADITSEGKFVRDVKYKDLVSDELERTESQWNEFALESAEKIKAAQTEPEYDFEIKDGKAVLNDVRLGLYLMLGESVTIDKWTYKPIPTLVMVPQWDGTDWIYDVETEPKKELEPVPTTPPADKTIDYSVIKKWANDNETVRPKEVRVSIKKGNSVVKTVVLNSDNNWSYSWSDKDDGIAYSVSEQIPEKYSPVYSHNAHEFTITNVYQETPPPVNTGDTTNSDVWLAILVGSILGVLIAGTVLLKEKNG